jgi:hypothetical protein
MDLAWMLMLVFTKTTGQTSAFRCTAPEVALPHKLLMMHP